MSISSTLSNALGGLTAASRMAEVVSSNVANAMTDGYGRRSVALSSASIAGRGAGVRIDGITRHEDRALLADRRAADSRLSGMTTLVDGLQRLEGLAGSVGSETSLDARIVALERAFVQASADPSSEVRLATIGDRLRDVASGLRDTAVGIRTQRQDADRSIADQVTDLNRTLVQVRDLNIDIANALNSGRDATALMDQRQVAIDRIARMVPVREMDRANGMLALVTPAGATLLDGDVSVVGFAATPTITPDMTFASGALSGLTLNGQPVDLNNGVGRLGGGSLAASFALRDEALVTAQTSLDAVAQDLVERFQDPAIDATLAPGDAGLLTDAGLAFDPLNAVGLSERIAVNTAVDPEQGGALFRLRDGVGAGAPGPVGSALQINAWIAGMDATRLPPNGGIATNASGLAARFVSEIGAARLDAEDVQSFANARFTTLREAELSNGVDTDQEMQMLLRIEQAYAANARVIQTVDSMIRQLMEL